MEGKGCEANKGTSNVPSASHMPGYDPNRIPASVFSSKPTIGWSFASSDTFYSIQNDSFSTAELRELPGVGEPSSEPAISRSLPIVVEESRDSPMSAQTTIEVVNGTVRDRAEQQHNNAKTRPMNVQHSSRISISSNDSHISINSFVFPILAGADHKIHSATFEVVFKGETVPKPEAQSMTKEPSQKESQDMEPQISAQNVKGGWCCWLKCFSCCRILC